MADDAPAESHAPSSQIPPLLRQRMINRAATFSEGAHPAPSVSRRRSSIVSDFSDTRRSFRSSTDNLLRPTGHDMTNLVALQEPTHWHSAPLAFAILPAIGGLLFKNGSSIVTDVLLLGLGSLFLNWCVRAPWDWYHAAQKVEVIESEFERNGDTIIEEDEDEEGGVAEKATSPDSGPNDEPVILEETFQKSRTVAQNAAHKELSREEIMALAACFFGPIFGAYLLHAIRSQLTRPSEGLVSNYNLTIFTMAAELRPVSHVIKLKQARMLHLQRIVRPELDPSDRSTKSNTQIISDRLADIETRLAEGSGSDRMIDNKANEISSTVRQGMQPQLDALNRAVRRYEKRSAAQSIQIEARFADLESRLKDALSLAAAAARTSQRPGVISMGLTWISSLMALLMQTTLAVLAYPFYMVASVFESIKSWFVRADRQPRKRIKGKNEDHPSMASSRVQSKTSR